MWPRGKGRTEGSEKASRKNVHRMRGDKAFYSSVDPGVLSPAASRPSSRSERRAGGGRGGKGQHEEETPLKSLRTRSRSHTGDLSTRDMSTRNPLSSHTATLATNNRLDAGGRGLSPARWRLRLLPSAASAASADAVARATASKDGELDEHVPEIITQVGSLASLPIA